MSAFKFFTRYVLRDGGVSRLILDRLLLALLGLSVAMISGIGYVIYWVCSELLLESSYRRKFGTGWRVEFEHDHGSLAHAHSKIAICVIGLFAMLLVVIWFWRQTLRKPRNRK